MDTFIQTTTGTDNTLATHWLFKHPTYCHCIVKVLPLENCVTSLYQLLVVVKFVACLDKVLLRVIRQVGLLINYHLNVIKKVSICKKKDDKLGTH